MSDAAIEHLYNGLMRFVGARSTPATREQIAREADRLLSEIMIPQIEVAIDVDEADRRIDVRVRCPLVLDYFPLKVSP